MYFWVIRFRRICTSLVLSLDILGRPSEHLACSLCECVVFSWHDVLDVGESMVTPALSPRVLDLPIWTLRHGDCVFYILIPETEVWIIDIWEFASTLASVLYVFSILPSSHKYIFLFNHRVSCSDQIKTNNGHCVIDFFSGIEAIPVSRSDKTIWVEREKITHGEWAANWSLLNHYYTFLSIKISCVNNHSCFKCV